MYSSLRFSLAASISLFFLLAPVGPAFVHRMGFDSSPHLLLVPLAAILVVGIYLSYQKRIPVPESAVVFYLCFLVFLGVASLHSVSYDNLSRSLMRQLEFMAPYFLLLLAYPLLPSLKNAVAASYLLGNWLAASLAIFLLLSGEVYYKGRLTFSEEHNPTAFAAHLGASLVICAYLWPKFPRWRWFLSLSMLTFLFSIILSQGKNALIALVLSATITVIFLARQGRKTAGGMAASKHRVVRLVLAALLVFGLLGVVIAWSLSRGVVDERFFSRLTESALEGDVDAFTTNRAWIWREYMNIHVPFFGLGFDNTAGFLDVSKIAHFPHNAFLLYYVQGGLIAVLLYVVFLFLLIRRSTGRRANDASSIIWLCFFLVLLSFGNDVTQYSYFWIPFAIWALLISPERRAGISLSRHCYRARVMRSGAARF